LSPRDAEQRTHDSVAAPLARAREAREAAAPFACDQVGLQNVVLLVGRRDALGAALARGLMQRVVADHARGRLRRQTQAPRDAVRVPPFRDEG
jgi:hypothetical protein